MPDDIDAGAFGTTWVYDTRKELWFKRCPQLKIAPLDRLEAAKPPEAKIDWKDLVEQVPARWWTENAAHLVAAPVGLIAERERRNEIFSRARVADLPGYRAAGSPHGPLARVVLLVDEYQELFEDDRLGEASDDLKRLAEQGRSAGVHMLLGSQRFGTAGMLQPGGHLRQRAPAHRDEDEHQRRAGAHGVRPHGAASRRAARSPGKIVINDQSGDDSANEFGEVAMLNAADRTPVPEALRERAQRDWPADRRFATVVFDGKEQPRFTENPQVLRVLREPGRPDAAGWRAIASVPAHAHGFGVRDWSLASVHWCGGAGRR